MNFLKALFSQNRNTSDKSLSELFSNEHERERMVKTAAESATEEQGELLRKYGAKARN